MTTGRVLRLLPLWLACGACSAHAPDAPPSGLLGNQHPFVAYEAGDEKVVASDDGGATAEAAAADVVEAEAEAEAGGPCDGVVQASQDVSEYSSIFALPAPMGGTITPGTYVLNEVTTSQAPDASVPDMPPTQLTGTFVHATIYATSDLLRIVEGRGTSDGDGGILYSDSIHAEAYTTSASMLSLTQVCPTAGKQSSMPYTATANGLTLFVSSVEYYGFRFVP